LKVSLDDVSAEMHVPVGEVERVLRRIQQFDPVGVAARDLKECLLIQLEQMAVRDSVAEKIVLEHLSLLKNRNHPAIARGVGVSLERVNQLRFSFPNWIPNRGRPLVAKSSRKSLPMSMSTRLRVNM
jgi:RNA polymerase sigma-54 factor